MKEKSFLACNAMNYANIFTARRDAGFSKGIAYLDEDLCYILEASHIFLSQILNIQSIFCIITYLEQFFTKPIITIKY